MNTFKEYYNNKPILSVREIIDIDGIGQVSAKIDTGNEAYNVLHGIDIEDLGAEITFTTVNNKRITRKKADTIKINIGSGVVEDRPVVKLNLKLNGKDYLDIPFSIGNREDNEDPVLIGEPFLKRLSAVVDVNKDSKPSEPDAV